MLNEAYTWLHVTRREMNENNLNNKRVLYTVIHFIYLDLYKKQHIIVIHFRYG